jgi:hypothetical protein
MASSSYRSMIIKSNGLLCEEHPIASTTNQATHCNLAALEAFEKSVG